MCARFAVSASHDKLTAEIDAIKGPLYAHGLLILMRRLPIVSPCKRGEGIRLGLGPATFRARPYSPQIARRLSGYLRMSAVLRSLKLAWVLQVFKRNTKIVLAHFAKYKAPQVGIGLYNKEWTNRQYQTAEPRLVGCRRYHHIPSDTVRMLPGPDVKDIRSKLGLHRLLSDLYGVQGVRVSPEYVTMAGCLRSGKFKETKVSAATRVSAWYAYPADAVRASWANAVTRIAVSVS